MEYFAWSYRSGIRVISDFKDEILKFGMSKEKNLIEKYVLTR